MSVRAGLTAIALGAIVGASLAGTPIGAQESSPERARAGAPGAAAEGTRRYTFSWPYAEQSALAPRGGTTRGPAVRLREPPTAGWTALQEPGLSRFERDRRAILAMAGEFRTSFDFIETVGFTADFTPDAPYQSWATEKVDVIEDSGERIVLQHVIVMQFIDESGAVQGPFVQKHWRQEWVYEDRSIHAYVGHDRWAETRFEPSDVTGRWSQAVFQVDDSPRYEAQGDWDHRSNYSAWTSDETWRPLPRRESSVRDDYHVLVGMNRHTITPSGWVQEEDNLKVVLDADGRIDPERGVLSRELGVNRYEAIVDFDFSARDVYWNLTGPFWADVRHEWERIYSTMERFELRAPPGEPPMFAPFFDYAAELEAGREYDPESGVEFIRETLETYLN
jgi:hypothetical protein